MTSRKINNMLTPLDSGISTPSRSLKIHNGELSLKNSTINEELTPTSSPSSPGFHINQRILGLSSSPLKMRHVFTG